MIPQQFTHTIHDETLFDRTGNLSMTAHVNLAKRGTVRLPGVEKKHKKSKDCYCGWPTQKLSEFETVAVTAKRTEELALGKSVEPTIHLKPEVAIGNPVALAILEMNGGFIEGTVNRKHPDGHECMHQLRHVYSEQEYIDSILKQFKDFRHEMGM